MVKLEIDGKPVEVANGSTVLDAAHKLGIYVPHFCYHKKLTIAANCRMCLVQVEKAPKPLPAQQPHRVLGSLATLPDSLLVLTCRVLHTRSLSAALFRLGKLVRRKGRR